MPLITQLPCEIVATILASLDHLSFLPPTLLACRHFYTSFKESHGIEASILRRQITPALVPHAVALMEASRLPRPFIASSVADLLDDLYNQPACLAARLPMLPPNLIRQMGRTHEAIHALAIDFATSAQDCIPPRDAASTGASTRIALSSLEYFRFCRAFYRVDLFYSLFRTGSFGDSMNPWFFSRHPPWENEQLGCIYEYLDATFARASRDVVAHDVFFGELSIDYLTPGEYNQWRHTWLSRGVEFVYNFTIAGSYDAKHTMLESSLGPSHGQVNLPEALLEVLSDFENDSRTLEEQSEHELLLSIAPCHGEQPEEDPDRGPYEAWRNLHADSTLLVSLMLDDDDWLRGRAYVFWDRDRLQKQFEDGFGKDPGRQPAYTDQDYEDMLESFNERSKIWQKGGTGYWARGDASRIVWPKR